MAAPTIANFGQLQRRRLNRRQSQTLEHVRHYKKINDTSTWNPIYTYPYCTYVGKQLVWREPYPRNNACVPALKRYHFDGNEHHRHHIERYCSFYSIVNGWTFMCTFYAFDRWSASAWDVRRAHRETCTQLEGCLPVKALIILKYRPCSRQAHLNNT